MGVITEFDLNIDEKEIIRLLGYKNSEPGEEVLEPLREELGSFLSAVDNGEEPKITGKDGIYALKAVTAAMKSAKDNLPVEINDY